MKEPTAHASPGTYEEIFRILNEKSQKKKIVLDCGAGEGAFSKELLKRDYRRIFAFDIQPSRFKIKDIPCKKVDLNGKLPYKNNTFDIIFAVEVIEHLENPWSAIRELNRILKDKGTIIITTPNVQNWICRLMFLSNTKLLSFLEKDFERNGHITPVFHWNFKRMLQKKFKIDGISFNRSRLPILRIDLPVKNFLLSENVIYKLKKV